MISTELRFEPDRWHRCTDKDWQDCDIAANCYSYALNDPKNYWSQPGLGFAKTKPEPYFESFSNYFKKFTLTQYMAKILIGVEQDGLIPVNNVDDIDDDHYPVALYFRDNPTEFDMHWYRRDDNGLWSHKNGWRAVTNLTDNGEVITDISIPPNCDVPILGGYYQVPRPGINIQKAFPLLSCDLNIL